MNSVTVQTLPPKTVGNPSGYEPGRSPVIRNILPGLTEIGKIKIGKKGELRPAKDGGTYQMPVKLDHFIVTTLERGSDGNFIEDKTIMSSIGPNAKRIPIRLLFDSLECNFQSRYASYKGKTMWCSGDGCGAFRLRDDGKGRDPVACPCGRQEPGYKGSDRCKMNGTLSCIIDGADVVGGVWKYRTTGYNSTVGMMSSLALIQALTGGILAGLDLDLTVQPKVGTDPDGKSVTIQVVGVVFRGSINALRDRSLQIATSSADFRQRMLRVEESVRMLISSETEAIDQAADIVDEFYPVDEAPRPLTPPSEMVPPGSPQVQAPVQDGVAGSTTATAPTPAPDQSPAPTRKRGRPSAQAQAPAEPAAPAAQPPAADSAPPPAPTPAAEAQPPAPPLVTPAGKKFDLFN